MNEAIIILGMHRSGTSCLTGCLKNHGLQLGLISGFNKHNQKGNQEDKNVFKLNESLLNLNNGTWREPPTQNKIIWNDEHQKKRSQIISEYLELPKPWGIKDPRMLLVYGFWKDHLPSHTLIGTFRHPLAVAKSLSKRTHHKLFVDQESAFKLWQIYNEKLIELYKQNKFPIINFDLPSSEYLDKLNFISTELKLKARSNNEFFDSNLRNQIKYERKDCPKSLLPLYDKLLEISI
jgi:hypothetical protein